MNPIALATRAAFCGVITIGLATATACSSDDPASESQVGGTVAIPLVATVGGSTYRLEAVFAITGAHGTTALATNDNEPVLTTTLPAGSYNALLESFTLFKADGTGAFHPLWATAVSDNLPFKIFSHSTTSLSFQFETQGEVVSIGSGNLNITFGVTETPGPCTALGAGCPDGYWCAPPALTGEPIACLLAGTVPLGSACTSPLDCVASSTCHDFGAGPVCTSLCTPSDFGGACATGGTCVELDPTFGLCTPEGACNPISVDRAGRTVQSGRFFLDFSNLLADNPEEVDVLRWAGGPNLVESFARDTCTSDVVEHFGNSWAPPDPNFGGLVLVGSGTRGTWEQDGASIVIRSASSGCAQSAAVPVETRYTFREGIGADTIEVERQFDLANTSLNRPFRPFMPRLVVDFDRVLHPDATQTFLVSEDVFACPYGCEPWNWDGSWFAYYASSGPFAGQGMIVRRAPSEVPANLWIDNDAGITTTNASSVLLLPPAGGFPPKVTETELLCFFDSESWTAAERASLALPAGCTLHLACNGSGTGGTGGMGGTGGAGGSSDAAVHVAPDGDDALALASNGATPFRNVQPAIDFVARNPDVATSVSVAAGPACDATADYPGPSGADLTMRDGITVSGKFESTGWTRCSGSVTRLLPATGNDVLFGADITHTSALDGFDIVSAPFDSTAAITVDGARGVRLVAVTMPERFEWPDAVQAPTFSYGVLVHANSEITITASDIFAPPGTAQSVGFESFDAQVVIEDSKVSALAPQDAEAIVINDASHARIARNTISARVTEDAIGALVPRLKSNDHFA